MINVRKTWELRFRIKIQRNFMEIFRKNEISKKFCLTKKKVLFHKNMKPEEF